MKNVSPVRNVWFASAQTSKTSQQSSTHLPPLHRISGLSKHTLGKSLTLYDFDGTPPTSTTLPFDPSQGPVVVVCNLSQQTAVRVQADGAEMVVDTFESCLVYDTYQQGMRICLPEGVAQRFCVLQVSCVDGACLFSELDAHVAQLKKDGMLAFVGAPSPFIVQHVKKLLALSTGSPHSIYMAEGYARLIIGMKLKQYQEKMKASHARVGDLKPGEVKRLLALSETIRRSPEQEYSISQLQQAAGLAIPKLQKGFKDLFGHTANVFIRNARLDRAEELMRTSDMNISEIVYAIGLTSRSYFSRIFREKYRCTPRSYLKRIKATF